MSSYSQFLVQYCNSSLCFQHVKPFLPLHENNSDVNYLPEGSVDDRAGNFSGFLSSDNFEGNDIWAGYNFQSEGPVAEVTFCQASNGLQFFSEFTTFSDAHFNAVSTVIQTLQAPTATGDPERSLMPDILKLPQRREKSVEISTPSLELLDEEIINDTSDEVTSPIVERGNALSTEEVVRVAAAHFIQLSALVSGDPSKLRLPFGLSYSNLTSDEVKNVDLVCLLMAAAERVSNQQFDKAKSLIGQCRTLSSHTGDPVRRVIYYFSEALQEKMDLETGKMSSKWQKEMEIMTGKDVIKALLSNHSVHLVVYNTLPFSQVLHFTAVQAILENMATAKKIHLVDLSIKHGLQWPILMQALATRHTCPIDSLKITAVGTLDEVISTTGKRLLSFAESLNLPFEFRTVIVPDQKDLKEDMFDLEEGEVLGILSDMVLNSMLVNPEGLEQLTRVICKLKPRVIVVIDVEAWLNSQSFINRFTEALFFYSAFFDCLDNLMEASHQDRMMIERDFFSQGIKCILAAEGSKRVIRYVGIRVWRSFFARFGLVETELSECSLFQASLLVNQFVTDGSCTVERNGNSLLTVWKGTPLHFVSAWKFLE